MTLPITTTLAGFLALLLVVLSVRVIGARQADGKGEEAAETLNRRIRGQGNLVEYAPMALVLFGALEAWGMNTLFLGALAALFAFARAIHGYAFGFTDYWGFGRLYGTAITLLVLLALGCTGLLFGILSAFG